MRKIQVLLPMLLALCFVSCKQHQPNFLFILVDDLGYADVGFVGTKNGIHTPNIDALREESMLFSNAYSASPVCSPTRASIMTGKYPSTLHLTCHIPEIGMQRYLKQCSAGKPFLEAPFIDRLPLEEVTIAEVLKEEGYSTGFFGKWHLAGAGAQMTQDGIVDERFHPQYQGFDVNVGGDAYGQPASYFSPYKNGEITDGDEGEYLTDRLTGEAIKYMQAQGAKPFFCYLSYYSIHTPHQVSQEYLDKNGGNKYNAMVNVMDDNIGRLLYWLKSEGLDENTMVIFYSDNGGVSDNQPLNGKKGSLYEGGIRVPLLVRYPNVVSENSVNKTPVISNDFFPTILEATDISLRGYAQSIEGVSFYPLLTQEKEFLEDRSLFWHFPHHRNVPMAMASAIRDGDWKLIYEYESKRISLFNLKNDPYEQYNLVNTEKDKVRELLVKLLNWEADTNVVMPEYNPDF